MVTRKCPAPQCLGCWPPVPLLPVLHVRQYWPSLPSLCCLLSLALPLPHSPVSAALCLSSEAGVGKARATKYTLAIPAASSHCCNQQPGFVPTPECTGPWTHRAGAVVQGHVGARVPVTHLGQVPGRSCAVRGCFQSPSITPATEDGNPAGARSGPKAAAQWVEGLLRSHSGLLVAFSAMTPSPSQACRVEEGMAV